MMYCQQPSYDWLGVTHSVTKEVLLRQHENPWEDANVNRTPYHTKYIDRFIKRLEE